LGGSIFNAYHQRRNHDLRCRLATLDLRHHNYYSHLSTLMSAHLCATIPNVRIMEIDIDDVPWKADLVTVPLDIKDGYLQIPSRPGGG
jgi:L-alanine-DL-glutamate epimerase-like enolase superfamily enzyme